MGNVRLKRVEGELVSSRSNFVVHQFRNREAWNFVGEASHVLRDGPDGLAHRLAGDPPGPRDHQRPAAHQHHPVRRRP
ncbi:aromatic-ring-hydroxylating dioxygenase subunit beta [Pseudomonas aeruginosa]|uniref:aromatic-ring-hydroxylating dioxygenase subunit beta n=1 Tax=Pseudomonas aeruginosa TaxID=287 RepID=UPI003D26AE81